MKTYTVMHFIESEGVYGAETVLLNLSEQMLKSTLYKPVIGCITHKQSEKSDLYDRADELGIEAKKIVLRNGAFFKDLPQAARNMREWGIDLIHSHGYKPSIYGFFLKRLTGIPVMATCHLWFRTKRPLKYHLMTALEMFLYRFFPVVIAVSKPIKEQLQKKGVAARKVQVIGNGIYVEKYNDEQGRKRSVARKALGIDDSEFVVITVGRLNEQKNHRVLVDAIKILTQTDTRYRCIIVGEGVLRTRLERQIKERGLDGKVMMLGFRKDIDDLLHASDAFVLTSRDEGLPMSFLEAISSRTPVIATAVGNIPHILADRKTGYVIRGEDADHTAETIAHVRNHMGQTCELASAAYEIVKERYSTETMFNSYDIVYRKLLDPSSITSGVNEQRGLLNGTD